MLSKFHDKREEEGFTLIELLVVIIIIGILAAIAIPTFLGQRERARRGSVQSDLRNMAINAETYFTDGGSYDDFTEGNDFLSYSPSTDVVLIGFEAGVYGFCIEGFHVEGDKAAIADHDAAVALEDQLPEDDQGFWVYDSAANPQLQRAAEYGTAGCVANTPPNATGPYAQGAGVGGAASSGPGILDGRPS